MRFILTAAGVFGALAIAVSYLGYGSANPVSDPTGDTYGVGGVVQLDISSVDAEYGSGNLVVTVTFSTPIQPTWADATNSVEGSIYIDTDQNPATGGAVADVGAEFSLDLSAVSGEIDVVEIAGGTAVGTGTIVFSSNSFTATVPLALLGNDSGLVDYYVLIGAPESPTSQYFFLTDEAPNQGVATSESAPTPTASPTATPARLPATGSTPDAGAGFPVAVVLGAVLLGIGAMAIARSRLTLRKGD